MHELCRSPFSRIVVAVDASAASQRAVRLAIALACADEQAELLFCHAIDIPRMLAHAERCCDDYALELEVAREDAQRVLKNCLRLAAQAGVAASSSIRFGKPAVEVVTLASALGADLVVVGGRRSRALRRFFRASVSDEVVRVSRLPVLVADSPAPQTAYKEEKTTL
jgi:nucleotide-binding universal stress UspA family protein